jgi:tripartite-type tricarboxylate transporter receptor subunit TctC
MNFVLSAVLALAAINPALAQRYPDKPIKLVVGFPPGTAADIVARIVAPKLGDGLGQAVVVDNRPGAGSNIGAELVARAMPDGYTLLVGTSANVISDSLYKLSFTFSTDLAPIALVAEVPGIVVAHPSGPSSIAELIAAAKASPGQIAYASSGAGTITQLWAELFALTTGAKLAHVPYKGSAPATIDLLAGRVTLQFTPASTVVPHIKAGKLKALAVTSATPSQALPGVPTVEQAGGPALKGYEASSWFGLLAPAGTPMDIVNRIQQETAKALRTPAMKERLLAQGAIPSGDTPAQFAQVIDRELKKWQPVVKASGAKVD